MNFSGKITDFFLKNKALTQILILSIVIGGVFGYIGTPKQFNPKVTLPAFEVGVDYENASAKEVSEYVTKELEEKLLEIPGVDKISSVSVDGHVTVNVQFYIGEDLNISKTKIQTKLSSNDDLRVEGISKPIIKSINPENVPIISIGFTSDKYSQGEIRELVSIFSDKLRSIKGIANINIHGGSEKAMKIFLNPGLMEHYGVGYNEIVSAIKNNNIKKNNGFIKNEKNVIQIKTSSKLIDINDFINLKIGKITLGDISEIKYDYLKHDSSLELIKKNGTKELIILSIAKRDGENSIKIVESVLKVLKENPIEGLKNEILRNTGNTAKNAINGLGINLIQSILIVGIVLLTFLGRVPALIVMTSIPITLLLVFISGFLLDQTINRITLFALILSLGLLVDSATVVTENIYRHLKEGKNKHQSIVEAVNEVGVGLFLSTLTSVIVFLPTSNLSGMMGAYMLPLSIFVPLALIFSLIVAYIIIPFFALYFLTPIKKEKQGFMFSISEKYGIILEQIFKNSKLQKRIKYGIFGLLFLSFTMPLLQFTLFKMLPIGDKNQFHVYINGNEGLDLKVTKDFSKKISNYILENENVKSIQSYVGLAPVVDFNGLFKGAHSRNQINQSTLKVNLIDKNKRTINSENLISKLELKMPFNENFKVIMIQDPPGPPVQSTFVLKIKGENDEIRRKIIGDLEKKLKKIKGTSGIDTSINHGYLKINYEVNTKKVLEYGITANDISQALTGYLNSIKVSQLYIEGSEKSFIELQVKGNQKDKLSDLSKIHIKGVPLNVLVTKKETRNSYEIYKDNSEKVDYLTSELDKRSVVYVAIDIIKEILNYKEHGLTLKSWNLYGFLFEDLEGNIYKIEHGGEFEMTLDSFRDLSIAMLFAFIMIFIVLVTQFKNFKEPLIILITVPLGLIGILFGFSILNFFEIFITATALIGFIALMGIVVNNAIIYLEYFHHLKNNGVEHGEALIKTGKTRLRPILLTSFTTILGLLTISGDPVWSGLSWAVIFGLTISTLMTLFILPIILYQTKIDNTSLK